MKHDKSPKNLSNKPQGKAKDHPRVAPRMEGVVKNAGIKESKKPKK